MGDTFGSHGYGPKSEAMYEANLQEGAIFSDHPAAGVWESLQGDACSPWELPTLESRAGGDSRHQSAKMSPEWDSTIVVHTPVTGAQAPGGKHKSNLPNHSQYAE
jgi:hypothetical protein